MQEIGLLEQTVLLLPETDAAGRRNLLLATGEPVGFARREQERWWWRWLRRVVAVHEVLDEPLVFTLRRSVLLTLSCSVYDAEEELVGTIAPPWILDRWGQPTVEMTATPGGGGVFQTLTGEVLAEWTPTGSAVRLALHDSAKGDPFLKMLLLAAMLQGPVG